MESITVAIQQTVSNGHKASAIFLTQNDGFIFYLYG